MNELGYPLVHPEIAGRPVSAAEMTWLYVDRVWRNLFHTHFDVMVRYRLEVLKAHHRARFSHAAENGSRKAFDDVGLTLLGYLAMI